MKEGIALFAKLDGTDFEPVAYVHIPGGSIQAKVEVAEREFREAHQIPTHYELRYAGSANHIRALYASAAKNVTEAGLGTPEFVNEFWKPFCEWLEQKHNAIVLSVEGSVLLNF